MGNFLDPSESDKSKRKKTLKKKTQTNEAPVEENVKCKGLLNPVNTNNKLQNKTCKLTEQKANVLDEQSSRRRRGSKKTRKKGNFDIAPRKIIHDPKLIGALPALPLFYKEIVVPVRDRHQYNDITKTVGWDCSELFAKPSILVIGSAEAGKSSLINYLLREKKGYESHYDVVRDYKSSFTHITYDEVPSLLRGNDASSTKSWQFNEITKYNKLKNECQIQLLQIKNTLLQEVTIIDSPPVSDSMISSIDQETTGYFPILNNLIRKVDLIIFVATSQISTSSINKVFILNYYKIIYIIDH